MSDDDINFDEQMLQEALKWNDENEDNFDASKKLEEIESTTYRGDRHRKTINFALMDDDDFGFDLDELNRELEREEKARKTLQNESLKKPKTKFSVLKITFFY